MTELLRASTSWFRSRSLRVRATVAVIGALMCLYAVWFGYDVLASVPDRDGIRALRIMPQASVLFDADDRPVFTLAKEHRIEVSLADVSPHLIRAVVAIEDRRFFDHEGFDPVRILASAVEVVRAWKAVQGGSTITQQLARQSLGREKTLRRKLKELLIAIELERHYTKREILELYLNKVYFGDGLYGVEAAARGYFSKRASELTIAEAALIAGLLQAPSAYAPTVNPEQAQARRNVVLQAMVDTKAISPAEYNARQVLPFSCGMACGGTSHLGRTSRRRCGKNSCSSSGGSACQKAAYRSTPRSIWRSSARRKRRSLRAFKRSIARYGGEPNHLSAVPPQNPMPRLMTRCRPHLLPSIRRLERFGR